jgi:hypothetical protein
MNRLFEESLKTRIDLDAAGQGGSLCGVREAEAPSVCSVLPGSSGRTWSCRWTTFRGGAGARRSARRARAYHRMERSYGSFSRHFNPHR